MRPKTVKAEADSGVFFSAFSFRKAEKMLANPLWLCYNSDDVSFEAWICDGVRLPAQLFVIANMAGKAGQALPGSDRFETVSERSR